MVSRSQLNCGRGDKLVWGLRESYRKECSPSGALRGGAKRKVTASLTFSASDDLKPTTGLVTMFAVEALTGDLGTSPPYLDTN